MVENDNDKMNYLMIYIYREISIEHKQNRNDDVRVMGWNGIHIHDIHNEWYVMYD